MTHSATDGTKGVVFIPDPNESDHTEGLTSRDCMLISESALSREWLTPEEDEAWKELDYSDIKRDSKVMKELRRRG